MRVTIVVLGDLGRSPRMLYHALALAAQQVHVDVIAYPGSLPHRFRSERLITCHLLSDRRTATRQGATRRWLLTGLLRAVRQTCALLHALLIRVDKPDLILIQNPPAVPVLLVALLSARLRSARLVIDWHNLTWSVLALTLGPRHRVVRLIERYERVLGHRADAHLSVSRAMQAMLADRWRIRSTVFYDRPADHLAPLSPSARAEARQRVCRDMGIDAADRTAVIIGPLGWTSDDDIDLLLRAVPLCEARIAAFEAGSGRAFPHLLILLTGRGPQRDRYLDEIARLTSRRLLVRAVWLEADDYPRLLGTGDLGLSLHRSSSGLDLPMKIADLFGAGVPVCALDYGPTLSEVLRDGHNGWLFRTSEELADQWVDLFKDFPEQAGRLGSLRRSAEQSATVRWSEGWREEAWPVLRPREDGPS